MGTVTTAAISSNVALNPAPGQAWIGSDVWPNPQLFAGKVTAAAGICAAGNIPTVTITPGSGTVASLTAQSGYDMAFSFTYVAGTASIFGGTVASVAYGQPLTAAPVAVLCTIANTGGTIGLPCGAIGLSKTGFSIQATAPASGGTYTVNCLTIRSPL